MALFPFPVFRLSARVLGVGDVFHPIDRRAVEFLLDGNMAHGGRRARAMPMLFSGCEPHNVTRPDFFDGSALALDPAETGCDDQGLSKRMRMPGGARARLECDECAAHARRIRRAEQRIDA